MTLRQGMTHMSHLDPGVQVRSTVRAWSRHRRWHHRWGGRPRYMVEAIMRSSHNSHNWSRSRMRSRSSRRRMVIMDLIIIYIITITICKQDSSNGQDNSHTNTNQKHHQQPLITKHRIPRWSQTHKLRPVCLTHCDQSPEPSTLLKLNKLTTLTHQPSQQIDSPSRPN